MMDQLLDAAAEEVKATTPLVPSTVVAADWLGVFWATPSWRRLPIGSPTVGVMTKFVEIGRLEVERETESGFPPSTALKESISVACVGRATRMAAVKAASPGGARRKAFIVSFIVCTMAKSTMYFRSSNRQQTRM